MLDFPYFTNGSFLPHSAEYKRLEKIFVFLQNKVTEICQWHYILYKVLLLKNFLTDLNDLSVFTEVI